MVKTQEATAMKLNREQTGSQTVKMVTPCKF